MTGFSLALIVVLSSLLFGSVEAWSMAIVGTMTALAFVFVVWRSSSGSSEFHPSREVAISMSILGIYPLFQLIPLPVSVVGMVHTKLKELLTLSPAGAPAFHSISIYPFATEMAFSRLMVYLMIFSMAAYWVRRENSVYGMIKALTVFGFLLSLFAIIQKATWNGKIYWFRELTQGGSPFGPFVNRNHFAGFIGMIIPLSLGISLRSRSRERMILYGFLTVVMAIALFFSLSRGGITSFFAGILVFSFVVLSRGRSKMKLMPVFFFVLVLAVYLLYLGISPIVERFIHTDVSNEQRFAAWQGVISAFRDYPLFGSGLGTFQYIFKINQPEGLYLYWDHAHNDYLELLLEGGVIGCAVVALFLFFVTRKIMSAEWAGRDAYLKAGVLSSLAAIAVHSVFDFNLQIPSNAILFFLVLGTGLALSLRDKGVEDEP